MPAFMQSLRRPLIFSCLYLAILSITWKIVKAPVFAEKPILAWASLFDLTVLTGFLFYVIVARHIKLSNIKIGLVLIAFLRIALFIVPITQSAQFLSWKILPLFIQIFALFALTYRITFVLKQFRVLRKSLDFEQSLEGAVSAVLGERVGVIIASEIRLLYYSLLWFRIKDRSSVEYQSLTTHEKSAQIALMVSLISLSLTETVIVHLVLSSWNITAALWISALSMYGILFIVADTVASCKRPSFLTASSIHLKLGLRWTGQIDLTTISQIDLISKKPAKTKNLLNGMLLVNPNLMLTFKEPITVSGLYGIKKQVTRLTIYFDYPVLIIESWNTSKPDTLPPTLQ